MHNNLNDSGKLVLRLTLGILILLHGIFKLTHGIGPIQGMVTGMGMPAFLPMASMRVKCWGRSCSSSASMRASAPR